MYNSVSDVRPFHLALLAVVIRKWINWCLVELLRSSQRGSALRFFFYPLSVCQMLCFLPRLTRMWHWTECDRWQITGSAWYINCDCAQQFLTLACRVPLSFALSLNLPVEGGDCHVYYKSFCILFCNPLTRYKHCDVSSIIFTTGINRLCKWIVQYFVKHSQC